MVMAATCLIDGPGGTVEIDVQMALRMLADAESDGRDKPAFRCMFCGAPVKPHDDGPSEHMEHYDRNPHCILSNVKERLTPKRAVANEDWQWSFKQLENELLSGNRGAYLKLYPQKQNEALFYSQEYSVHPLHLKDPDELGTPGLFDAISEIIRRLPVKRDPRGFYRCAVLDWVAFVEVVRSFSRALQLSTGESRKELAITREEGKAAAIWRMIAVARAAANASGRTNLRVFKVKEAELSDVEFANLLNDLIARQNGKCAITDLKLDFNEESKDKAFLCSLDRIDSNGHYERRIQPVIATHSLNRSAGVRKPSVLRGLSFNCLAIELSCSCE